jgi:hypothetical protein
VNLAFKLHKPFTKADFESFRIVSLWDMVPFYAVVFFNIHTQLVIWEKIIENKATEQNGHLVITLPEDTKESFTGIPAALDEIEFNVSKRSAEETVSFVNSDDVLDAQELRHLFRCFRAAFMFEVENRRVLMLPTSRDDFYDKEGTFLSAELLTKLSKLNLTEDAAEAGNCFALGRYTACVFHLMRIMERVVQHFGQRAKISLDVKKANWDNILKQVKKMTEIKETDTPKIKKKKLRYQTFYNRLDAVRVAWRNQVMHPKVTYTPEEAKEVLDAVKLFVKDFSTLR